MSTRKANKALTDSPTSVSSEPNSTRSATATAETTPPPVATAIVSPSTPTTTSAVGSTGTGSEFEMLRPATPPPFKTSTPAILRPGTPAIHRPGTPAILRPGTPAIFRTATPAILRPATLAIVTTSPTANTDTIVPESKRPRRSTVRTPTTPSTPSAYNAKKKSEPDADESASTCGDGDDDKSVKSEGDAASSISDSPARNSRRRKALEKTSIVTRKTITDMAKPTTRVLRCVRRNSTGRFESPEKPEMKRRSGRRAVCSTPEPGATAAANKRRRTNSVRPDDKDDVKQPEKIIKIEAIEPKDEEDEKLKLLVEETDSKDDELVEVVAIKLEMEEEIEVPMEEGFLKDPVEEELITDIEPAKEEEIMLPEAEGSSEQCIENEKEEVKKVPINQKGGKRSAAQATESGSQKKAAVKKDEVKLEKDSKYEAYERPRRVCQKKLMDLPQTPKRSYRRAEKRSEANSDTKATKSNRKSQTKASPVAEAAKKVESPKIKLERPDEVEKKETVNIMSEVIVNGVDEPLTVDTASISMVTEKNPPSSNSEQSTDSEGINIMSVQKFYKKPEFLENNMGIEKDPKLGEIIQEAEKSKDVPSSCEAILPTLPVSGDSVLNEDPERSPSCSGDSLKEGERLVLDDSTEDDGIGKIEGELTPEVFISQETEMIDTVDVGEPRQIKKDGEKQEKGENILSNSTATENVDALQTICDSTNVNTAVDEEEEGVEGSKDEQEGDIETKDNTACNIKTGGGEEIDKENKVEPAEDEITTEEMKSLEEDVEENSCSSDAVGKEELTLKFQSTESTTMDVDSEELSGGAADVITEGVSDDAGEKSTTGEVVEIETTAIIEDVDEKMDLEADDVKESKENIKNCINTPKKIEKSDVAGTKEAKERKPVETPETLKQKENHLKNLGLLTHKAAVEAKIEKQRRRKLLQTTATGSSGSGKKNGSGNGIGGNANIGNSSSSSETGDGSSSSTSSTSSGQAAAGNGNKSSQEYTGTLKTVIKLNRQSNGSNINDNRRKLAGSGSGGSNGSNGGGGGRQSLKMTFQKGRGRGTNSEKDTNQSINTGEDTYYTIQNETEDAQQQQDAVAHGRKSHNRYHTTDGTSAAAATDPIEKLVAKEIVIPEKASSFDIHPGRLCQDQCFYCGGKFGLYDTPCHVAQLKSAERQKKILENEEKLTVDNCLCDACFRHVDRRANHPNSYKKRSSAPASIHANNSTIGDSAHSATSQADTSMDEEQSEHAHPVTPKNICFVPDCKGEAVHSLRRRNIRKTIKKILPNFDLSTIGCMAPTCAKHHEAIVQVLGCSLCKRRLVKNQMYINHESERLEKILAEQGIPAKLGNNTAVCKLCRYFTSLLLKPPEVGKVQKKQFVKNYRKRLLHFYNMADTVSDGEEQAEEKNEDNIKQDGQKKIDKRVKKKKSLSTTQELVEGEKSSRAETGTPQSSEDDQLPVCAATSGQMMLDNDVMVDYDMPVPISDSPSPPPLQIPSKLQTILQSGVSNKDDISIVLRSNPNISMRELFPGEEEMGLQINVPFGSSTSVRTPEGWTRVNTFLQYDEPTRRLWEELQKPYGNQSSFLRHLILLEKFFRNGDLILSQNASTNAGVYSDTVQNRLRSYDNLPAQLKAGKSRTTIEQGPYSPDKISKRFGNLPVTITAKPKSQATVDPCSSGSTSSSSSSSSASSPGNVNSILKSNLLANNRSIEILPIGGGEGSSGFGTRNSSGGLTRQQKLLDAATRLINNQDNSQGSHKKSGSAPLGSVPPELISIGRNQGTPLQMKGRQLLMHSKPGTSKSAIPPNVIVLPESLTALERMQSKNWRPTLVPVNSVNPGAHLQASGPLYQTADGRRLPALVQVQSGGKPYLISIHDYNRMCILRREKLMREQMLKGGKKPGEEGVNRSENIYKPQSLQHKMHIPNKILEQNSLIPVQSKQKSGDLKARKQPQQSLLKSASVNSLVSIAPKPTGQLPIIPPSIASQQHAIMLSQSNTASIANSGGAVSILPTISSVLTLAAPTTSSSSTSWLWNNTNDGNTLNGNLMHKTAAAGSSSSGSSSSSSSPSALKHQGNAGAIVFDNSVLSKIPKSLTVIPQRKSQGRPRRGSGDDLTSA